MRRFYVDSARMAAGDPVLEGPDAVHLRRVLRLGPGDAVVVFDGAGREYDARVEGFDGARVRLRITGHRRADTESPLRITLVQGFLKETKMDELVRRTTELGVTRFAAFFAARSVSRPGPERLAARTARWKRIARESLKQCRRSRVPRIEALGGLGDVIALAEAADVRIVFWEEAAVPLSEIADRTAARPEEILLLLGPEGGLEPGEVEPLVEAGFDVAGLGPRILRAETATMAACTLAQYIFGDMGGRR